MRKLKCILGHNQRLMNLSDVTTEEYENNHEAIKTYKCKHCGVIVGGKTLSVKPKTIFDKDVEEKEDKEELNSHDVKIYEYQNWSIHNMGQSITPYNKNKGVFYFVSKDEITEMEFYGFAQLVQEKFKMYEGLDINYTIYRAKYYEHITCIKPNYGIKGVITKEAINYGKYVFDNINIKDADIIAIEYDIVKRYEKSKFWRLFHRRICKGEYYID